MYVEVFIMSSFIISIFTYSLFINIFISTSLSSNICIFFNSSSLFKEYNCSFSSLLSIKYKILLIISSFVFFLLTFFNNFCIEAAFNFSLYFSILIEILDIFSIFKSLSVSFIILFLIFLFFLITNLATSDSLVWYSPNFFINFFLDNFSSSFFLL